MKHSKTHRFRPVTPNVILQNLGLSICTLFVELPLIKSTNNTTQHPIDYGDTQYPIDYVDTQYPIDYGDTQSRISGSDEVASDPLPRNQIENMVSAYPTGNRKHVARRDRKNIIYHRKQERNLEDRESEGDDSPDRSEYSQADQMSISYSDDSYSDDSFPYLIPDWEAIREEEADQDYYNRYGLSNSYESSSYESSSYESSRDEYPVDDV